ncbi:Flp pilus assembly protein CpaB [Phenylobacterium sp.]|uniref:Flp pilus assembly protein CpaB n=1 Tax=Phenylobacterium sp. TaxID=1871053 RepID=UPI002737BDE0|nr:Flp pilus assembly protein CpaB [Phenylobacterium sp.]MDP3869323.1 Flp pilus assembly protein CpaB [Phenylobacterium sp.]
MPIRTLATLAIAILLGLVAVALANMWLGRQRNVEASTVSLAGTVPVVVATQPIERGVALQPAALKVVRFPQAAAPAGALSTIEEASAGGQRLALRAIVINEPILATKITAPGGKVNLSAAMTPGMRAVTFRANDVAGVAGFVLPGDRVDVLVTRDTGAQGGKSGSTFVTQILADNLKVLGVDQLDDDTTTKPVVVKAITLEVTPAQAQVISLAQAVGTVSLALRQVGDQTAVDKRMTTVADLGGRGPMLRTAAPRRAARPATPGLRVNVTRGVITSDYAVSR